LTSAARNPKKIKTADEAEDEAADEAAETEADEAEAGVVSVIEAVEAAEAVDEVVDEEHQVSLLKPTEEPSKNFKEARKHLTTPIKLIS
jgi:RNA-splicing ligase RtcB